MRLPLKRGTVALQLVWAALGGERIAGSSERSRDPLDIA